MKYFKRRALIVRLALLVAMVALSLTALTAVYMASGAHLAAADRQAKINDDSSELTVASVRIQAECRVALQDPTRVDTEMLKALLRELAEQACNSARALAQEGDALLIKSEGEELRAEAQQLELLVRQLAAQTGADRTTLADLLHGASSLERLSNDMQEESEGVFAETARQGERRMLFAAVCLLLSLGAGLAAGLQLFLDMVNEAVGPLDLETELRRVERKPDFQQRMSRLAPGAPAGADAPSWRLVPGRLLRVERTHTTFEALAVQGTREVRLFGKCYRWVGLLKSVQRLIWPAYGRGAWRALNVMHSRGLNGPLPLAAMRIRRGALSVGALVLTEYIADVVAVKVFVQVQFPRMEPAARRLFLERLLEYWNNLHAAGVHTIAVRCLHGIELTAQSADSARFCLLDLDRVCVSRAPKGWGYRCAVRLDNRRLRTWLWEHLTPDEARYVDEMLHPATTVR